MLWLDGVYEPMASRPDKPRLHRTRAPTSEQLTHLADKIAHRVCRHLVRQGWLEGEEDSAFLSERAGGDGLDALRMSSITYRIATGAQAGRKVATLQTLPDDAGPPAGGRCRLGRRLLAACGRGSRSAREPEARTPVPVHRAPGDFGEAAIDLAAGQGALPAQDAVEERHDARGV